MKQKLALCNFCQKTKEEILNVKEISEGTKIYLKTRIQKKYYTEKFELFVRKMINSYNVFGKKNNNGQTINVSGQM